MRLKLEILLMYLVARSAEQSTWKGVAVFLTLIGSKYATLDWGQVAALGIALSAVMKIFLPDVKPPKE